MATDIYVSFARQQQHEQAAAAVPLILDLCVHTFSFIIL